MILFFLNSWLLFKEYVNEVYLDSKNKEFVKLYIYVGYEIFFKYKV